MILLYSPGHGHCPSDNLRSGPVQHRGADAQPDIRAVLLSELPHERLCLPRQHHLMPGRFAVPSASLREQQPPPDHLIDCKWFTTAFDLPGRHKDRYKHVLDCCP